MNPKEFRTAYCHTLQTDPKTKRNYIELPISNLNELAYMQESLLEGILLLAQLEERHYKREQMQSVMYWLCKLVLLSYPHDELGGLSKWLET
ncbi:hypothetical protein MHTCC0001_35420 [Flavobacteriaceae bacterium MHTCC 0001]